jgi:hypothetical protein
MSSRHDCPENLIMTDAAAEIAGKGLLDRFFGRGGVFVEERFGAEDHPGRAKAALKGRIVDK